MDIRRLFLILATVVLMTSVWAQAELEEPSQPDTLNIQSAVIDTLEERIDPKILLVEMNNFLAEKRKNEDDLFLPNLIYNENFHLSSPFNLNMRITKNGFSEIPFATSNFQTVQNNRSIYKTIYKRGNIFYNSWEYSLPVAITETYMGLGDNDMNNIAVSLMKGKIFGIPKFDIQLDYLGEKGKWLGYEDEASRNFHLHLVYDLDFAKIHFDNTIIDQELPGEKDMDGYLYAFDYTSNKENEYSLKIENKVIDLGIKYKSNNYKMLDVFRKKRDLIQFLALKKIKVRNHKLDLSYELVAEDISTHIYSTLQNTARDDSYHILSFDHDSSLLGFNFGNTGCYQDENNFQFNSELIKEIFYGFNLFGEYSTSSNDFFLDSLPSIFQNQSKSRIGGGILIDPFLLKSKITIGQHTIEGFKGEYFEVQNQLNLKMFNRVGITFKQWLRNEQTTVCVNLDSNYNLHSFPDWQLSNFVELSYLLDYDNAIKLGLNHIYHSNFSYTLEDLDTIFTNDTNNFDAYLKIQLTDRFEISVDAVNLSNNKVMFTNNDHPSTHFNFNVHWIFAN